MTSEAFVADHSSHEPAPDAAPDAGAELSTQSTGTEPAGDVPTPDAPGKTELSTAMDAVNLERALIDFEIANARVIDLTARLTEFSRDLLATRSELGLAKVRLAELENAAAELQTIKGSAAYKTMRKLGDTRARLMHR